LKQPRDPEPVAVKVIEYREPASLADVRRLVAQQAAQAGLTADKAQALGVAVNELAVYSLRNRKAGGIVSIWATPADLRVTIAASAGFSTVSGMHAADDPAAEHGLLLVGALCDHVTIREHADAITIHLAIPRP
jgi:hypothetical protein